MWGAGGSEEVSTLERESKEIKDIVAWARWEGREGFFHLTLDRVGFLYV